MFTCVTLKNLCPSYIEVARVSGEDANRVGSHRPITEQCPLHWESFSDTASVPQTDLAMSLEMLGTLVAQDQSYSSKLEWGTCKLFLLPTINNINDNDNDKNL